MIMKKSILTAAVLMAMGSGAAHAITTNNNNFSMINAGGGLTGGTNDVKFTWDGTYNTNVSTAVSNATLATTTPTTFFGAVWTAYEVKIFAPGTYTISTADTLLSAGCPITAGFTCASGGSYTVTAASNQLVAWMKFAWAGTQGIDVVDVWQQGSWTTFNPTNPIATGPGGTYLGPTYDAVSTDWDGDGKAGALFIDGPFATTNAANFNVNGVTYQQPVPIPAAVWLFGSGLLGLVGVARRKKKA